MSLIKEKVKLICKKHETTNPYLIAKNLNIHVHEMPLHEEINGFYKYDRRNQYIIINEHLSSERQYFTCGHELGHAVLHPKLNTHFFRNKTFYSIDKIETEANLFAVELLLLDAAFKSITIHEATELYGIPEQLLYKKFYA
jgi:Zn-dependent peptidase ImmA (M78 family)